MPGITLSGPARDDPWTLRQGPLTVSAARATGPLRWQILCAASPGGARAGGPFHRLDDRRWITMPSLSAPQARSPIRPDERPLCLRRKRTCRHRQRGRPQSRLFCKAAWLPDEAKRRKLPKAASRKAAVGGRPCEKDQSDSPAVEEDAESLICTSGNLATGARPRLAPPRHARR
jgi:hypothetical protein